MVYELSVNYKNVNPNIPDFSTFSLNLNAWDLLPIVIICSLSIFLTLLWLIMVWLYLRKSSKLLYKPHRQNQQAAKMQHNQVESYSTTT